MSRLNLPTSHPVARIKLVALDYESGNASIVTPDGQIFTDRISAATDYGFVRRSTFIPAETRMEMPRSVVSVGSSVSLAFAAPNCVHSSGEPQ